MSLRPLNTAPALFGVVMLMSMLALASTAHSQVITVEAQSTLGPRNCYPFGGSPQRYQHVGHIYKNIPAFALQAGDTIAFDLGLANDQDIVVNIEMAATTTNGGNIPAGAYTRIVNAGTPATPRGDNIVGNYELVFTVEQPFIFPGGGLIIRYTGAGQFLSSDPTCTQVLMYGNGSDPSGFFVERFWDDPDGLPPYSNLTQDYIANFKISASGSITLTASDANESVDEDVAKTILLQGSDPLNRPLTYRLVTMPAQGTISGFNASTGQLIYTPNANYNGTDRFTYELTAGAQTSNTATVNITIAPVNDGPVAGMAQTLTTAEDTALTGSVMATDVDNDPLTYRVDVTPTQGMLTLDAMTGQFTYTPNADYNGADSFSVIANDGTADSGAINVSINVTPVNDAPIAGMSQTAIIDEDTMLMGSINAMDVDNDPLAYRVEVMPTQGTIMLDAMTGQFIYTPNADYNGADSFSVIASDGTVDTMPTTISITITPVNDAPVAGMDQTLTTAEDTALTGSVMAIDVDNDPLTYRVDVTPTQGMLTLDAMTGQFTYTPNADYNGADSFSVIASDGTVDTAPMSVNITVTPVNDAPVFVSPPTPAQDEAIAAAAGELLSITFKATDEPTDTLTFTITGAPEGTQAVETTDELQLSWTPSWQDAGTYTIEVKVSDGSLEATRSITVTVTATDADADGVPDALEVELGLDPTKADSDGDTISDLEELGDLLDPADTDQDQTIDALDEDSDDDGISDLDEAGDQDLTTPAIDSDDDGVPNYQDDDSDKDTIIDGMDNCRLIPNTEQLDTDEDGQGDACQDDDDADGVLDDTDNCPQVSNADQADLDQDGSGDVCDGDDDNDGVADDADNCPLVTNADQADLDNDGIGSACDDNENSPPGPRATEDEGCGCASVTPQRQLPATLLYLIVGLVGMLSWRRRRRR